MFKALLKKQLLELVSGFLIDGKTKKRRSKGGLILYIGLAVFVFLLLAFAVFAMADPLCEAFCGHGDDWLYFSCMSLAALLLSVFGSVFSTYASLYKSKDNEILLSLPIPPSKIVLSRLAGVYLTALLFGAVVMLPMSAAYWINVAATPALVIFPLVTTLSISLLSVTLTCLLGWVIALIDSKLKSKAFSKALITLVFIALYFLFFKRLESLTERLIQNGLKLAALFKGSLYPFYLCGRGASGDILSLLIFTAGALALLLICMRLLSATFVGMTTKKAAGTKAVYREKPVRARSPRRALLWREWKRFTTSSTYMLNTALGTVLMPLGAVALVIYASKTVRTLIPILELPDGIAELACVAALGFMLSFNTITTPSVSLEGKYIYIAQTLPVRARDVLRAKLELHLLLTFPPALILSLAAAYTVRLSVPNTALLILFTAAFCALSAGAGLYINLKRPVLNWVNETVAIKQSLAALIMIFGTWVVDVALVVLGLFALKIMSSTLFLLLITLVLGGLDLILYRALMHRGADIYARLG